MKEYLIDVRNKESKDINIVWDELSERVYI